MESPKQFVTSSSSESFLASSSGGLPQATVPSNISQTPLSANASLANLAITSPLTALNGLLSAIKLPLSLSTLRDWLKIILIGGSLETFRQFVSVLHQRLKQSIIITAKFEDSDDSYDWMIHWLVKHPSFAKSRDVTFTTKSGPDGMAVLMPEDAISQSSDRNKNQLAFLPSIATSSLLWYKGHVLWVSRGEQDASKGPVPFQPLRREQFLVVKILAFSKKILSQILLEAKANYLASQEDTISIYSYDMLTRWRKLADRPRRSLNSIILDPGMKDMLITDAKDFLSSKTWYAARGIPFRRGYLLASFSCYSRRHGAPGSGKTSLIHSLAGELGLKILVISLSHPELNDTALREIMTALPEQCIALIEDIDAAFTQTMNRDLPSDEDTEDSISVSRNKNQGSTNKITLSGLLNVLDGIGAAEGRILFATTNKYSSLDPALCRPGRMDVHVEFRLASKFQARQFYKTFYAPDSESQDRDPDRPNGGINEKVADLVDLEALITTSGEDIVEPSSTGDVAITGTFHQRRAPQLSCKVLIGLANAFAENIPERQVSMAALQGYLIQYKTRPVEAVKNVRAWAIKEKETQAKRQAMNGDRKRDEKGKELPSELD
ncbi:P-loop containing nucleoside triphosphate hydrolase protein [Amanita muscaria]